MKKYILSILALTAFLFASCSDLSKSDSKEEKYVTVNLCTEEDSSDSGRSILYPFGSVVAIFNNSDKYAISDMTLTVSNEENDYIATYSYKESMDPDGIINVTEDSLQFTKAVKKIKFPVPVNSEGDNYSYDLKLSVLAEEYGDDEITASFTFEGSTVIDFLVSDESYSCDLMLHPVYSDDADALGGFGFKLSWSFLSDPNDMYTFNSDYLYIVLTNCDDPDRRYSNDTDGVIKVTTGDLIDITTESDEFEDGKCIKAGYYKLSIFYDGEALSFKDDILFISEGCFYDFGTINPLMLQDKTGEYYLQNETEFWALCNELIDDFSMWISSESGYIMNANLYCPENFIFDYKKFQEFDITDSRVASADESYQFYINVFVNANNDYSLYKSYYNDNFVLSTQDGGLLNVTNSTENATPLGLDATNFGDYTDFYFNLSKGIFIYNLAYGTMNLYINLKSEDLDKYYTSASSPIFVEFNCSPNYMIYVDGVHYSENYELSYAYDENDVTGMTCYYFLTPKN